MNPPTNPPKISVEIIRDPDTNKAISTTIRGSKIENMTEEQVTQIIAMLKSEDPNMIGQIGYKPENPPSDVGEDVTPKSEEDITPTPMSDLAAYSFTAEDE